MARNFLLNWVSKNVKADAFRKGRAEAKLLADRLAAAAADRGFSRSKLEAAAGERLPDFLYVAMEDAAILQTRLSSPSE
jgi:hypothetical protein